VFASHGEGLAGQRFVAVRPERRGDSIEPVIAYEFKRAVPLVPSFVVKDDLLFLWTDSGIVTCVDAATGERHWQERVGGSFYSSPVWIDGRLFCVSKRGKVVVLAARKTYELLGKVDLGERCFAVPAVAGGVLYLRTQSRLLSLGGKAAE